MFEDILLPYFYFFLNYLFKINFYPFDGKSYKILNEYTNYGDSIDYDVSNTKSLFNCIKVNDIVMFKNILQNTNYIPMNLLENLFFSGTIFKDWL